MLSYAAVSTCLALGATATPFILTARDAISLGPWCDAFGTAGIDAVSNFTLAARNVTSLPSSENVSMEDVLLVLGAAGVTAGAELKVLTVSGTSTITFQEADRDVVSRRRTRLIHTMTITHSLSFTAY